MSDTKPELKVGSVVIYLYDSCNTKDTIEYLALGTYPNGVSIWVGKVTHIKADGSIIADWWRSISPMTYDTCVLRQYDTPAERVLALDSEMIAMAVLAELSN